VGLCLSVRQVTSLPMTSLSVNGKTSTWCDRDTFRLHRSWLIRTSHAPPSTSCSNAVDTTSIETRTMNGWTKQIRKTILITEWMKSVRWVTVHGEKSIVDWRERIVEQVLAWSETLKNEWCKMRWWWGMLVFGLGFWKSYLLTSGEESENWWKQGQSETVYVHQGESGFWSPYPRTRDPDYLHNLTGLSCPRTHMWENFFMKVSSLSPKIYAKLWKNALSRNVEESAKNTWTRIRKQMTAKI